MEIQWSLIVFTLFTCLASGTFALQGLLAALGRGQVVQLSAVITAFAAIVIGGIASFTHLQHWDRAFNGFGHITSGITQELIGIVVMVIAMVIYFAVSRKGSTPTWAGIMALIVGVAMVVVMTTSYMMPARPVWSTPALYVFYLAQALVAGAATLWFIAAVKKDGAAAALGAKATALGGALVVVSLAVYAAVIASVHFPEVGYYFDPTQPTKEMADASNLAGQLLTGSLAGYFWASLVVGGVVAFVLGVLKWKDASGSLAFACVSVVCALAGGIAFRTVLYVLGASVFIFY
jgi:anaerobic dimethyl sulfoxide reductase subunit C (anchor subunit)